MQPQTPTWQALPPRRTYEVLRAYYHSNNLYENIQAVLRAQSIWSPAMKPLRNPAYRIAEFYSAKIMGGPLAEAIAIETENPAIVGAIEQLWTWSNWGSQKQAAMRTLAITGDWFVKIATRTDKDGRPVRVYLQTIEPEFVTDFSEDERGFIAYIRIDVPRADRGADGKMRAVTHTEVWDKERDRYRVWTHEKGADEELDRLGTPATDVPLTSLGIDFVPFAHAMLRDVGQARGMAAIMPALAKIDEANMQATRLHQLLFRHNKSFWALTRSGLDAAGRPLPPIRVDGSAGGSGIVSETVDIGDDDYISLPGGGDLKALVPSIAYGDALAILNAQLDEIERDLPELAYYALRSRGDLSGKAVRLLLSDAIDRLEEARGNAFATLIQAHEMALTIGAANNLPGFEGIGTFEAGNFEHTLIGRPVVPVDALELEQELTLQVEDLSWESRMQARGWTPEEIEAERERLEKDGTSAPGNAALAAVDTEIKRTASLPAGLMPGQPDYEQRARTPGGE